MFVRLLLWRFYIIKINLKHKKKTIKPLWTTKCAASLCQKLQATTKPNPYRQLLTGDGFPYGMRVTNIWRVYAERLGFVSNVSWFSRARCPRKVCLFRSPPKRRLRAHIEFRCVLRCGDCHWMARMKYDFDHRKTARCVSRLRRDHKRTSCAAHICLKYTTTRIVLSPIHATRHNKQIKKAITTLFVITAHRNDNERAFSYQVKGFVEAAKL